MRKNLPSRINPNVEPVKLDVKDIKLLGLLGENSRESYSSLAKKIALSRESIAYRTSRYLEKGIIVKPFAKVDLTKIGWQLFRVFFNVDEGKPEDIKKLLAHLKEHPNTLHLIEFSDRWDLEWKFTAKSLDDFNKILDQVMGKFSGVILEKEKMHVVKNYMSRYVPEMLRGKELIENIKKRNDEQVKVDEKDIKILVELNKDAQISTYKLAEKIKMSADGIGLRIKKLVKSGLIERFTIISNLSLLGYTWYTFVINLDRLGDKNEAKLVEFIRKHPNIIKCERVFGNYDLLFHIVVRNQIEFHNTIIDLKKHFADVLRTYDTWVLYQDLYSATLPKVILEG